MSTHGTDPPPEPPPVVASNFRRAAPAIGAALSIAVVFVAVLSIPLKVGESVGLTEPETIGWIVAFYGVSSALSLILVYRYRQPLLLTGNLFVLIFIASLGSELTWGELIGASMLAGLLVLVLGPLGLTHKLALWIPGPIVFGLLAGAVLPFVVELFTALGSDLAVVGGAMGAYVVGRRMLDSPQTAILPALAAGLAIAAVTGQIGPLPSTIDLPMPILTAPVFSVRAILTATPVLLILITLEADIPSIVFLRTQGYEPPEQTLNIVSGTGTLLGSLLGPMGVSLALPATAVLAGPDAGTPEVRHWSVYMVATFGLVVALFAGLAIQLAAIIPTGLLAAGVGLAMIGVLEGSLQKITAGPLLLGPLFAFAVSLSDFSFLGLGPFFWALIVGLATSQLLERDAWKASHVSTA